MAKKKKVNRFVKLMDEVPAREVAEVLGVPVNTVHQYRGRLSLNPQHKLLPHHIVKLCSAFDIPPFEFDPELWPDRSWRF